MSLRMEPSSARVPPPPVKPPSRSNSSSNLARAPSTVPIAPSQGPSRIPMVLSRAQTEIRLNTQPAIPTSRYQGTVQQEQLAGSNSSRYAATQQQPVSHQQLRSACSEPEQQQQVQQSYQPQQQQMQQSYQPQQQQMQQSYQPQQQQMQQSYQPQQQQMQQSYQPQQQQMQQSYQPQQQQVQQSYQPQQSSIAFVGSTTYSSDASPSVSVNARPQQQQSLQQVDAPPPLPDIAVQRLQQSSGGIDRESLRPAGYRSTTPVRNMGSIGNANTSTATAFSKHQQPSAAYGSGPTGGGGSGFSRAAAAFASPSREDFRRATSPGMSWASSAAPRFRYEPPPMLPTYYDVERLALTPVKERRKESDEPRQRLPVKERWGPPVRTIPNRFNSIPTSGAQQEFEEENEDDGYARRVLRDETRSSRRGAERQSRYGDRYDEPRSERRRHHRRHLEDIVVTPREDDQQASRRHHRDVYADASIRYETPNKHERREERSERRSRRHEHPVDVSDRHGKHRSHRELDPSSPREDEQRRSRRHRDNRYEIDDSHRRVRSDEEGYERKHRVSAHHQLIDDPQSPDSYVVGSSKGATLSSGRDLLVEVEHARHAASPSASSRRRNDETEEQYRVRRRAEREHRRMLAR